MLIPFNVVLRKNSRRLQDKQQRGKYRNQTYIRTSSNKKTKPSIKKRYLELENETSSDEEKSYIMQITK